MTENKPMTFDHQKNQPKAVNLKLPKLSTAVNAQYE